MRDGKFDAAELVLMRSANVLRMNIRETLLSQPFGDFEVGDHECPGPPGDVDRIADMVPMPVGNDDRIGLYCTGSR